MNKEMTAQATRCLVVSGLCVALFACGPKTEWSTKMASPDGRWVAGARTQTWSGPGIGTAATSVYLARARDLQNATDVIGYFEGVASPHPQLRWITSSNLVVEVPDPNNLNLQVVKFADVRITVAPITDTISGSIAR
jgi:hypothetical protein